MKNGNISMNKLPVTCLHNKWTDDRQPTFNAKIALERSLNHASLSRPYPERNEILKTGKINACAAKLSILLDRHVVLKLGLYIEGVAHLLTALS